MDALLGPLVILARAGLARGGAVAGRISIAALCGVLGGIAAIAAVGFSLSALWIVALPRVGPAGAALVLAGVLAVLCLVLLSLACAIARRGRQKPRFEPNAEASLLAAAQLFNEHKGAMLLAALVAGLGAGAGSRGGNR
jgi:hypothetical protein